MPDKEERKAGSSDKEVDFFDQLRGELDKALDEKERSVRSAAEYLDKLQRLQADMENLQKMTRRQIETVTKQASEGVIVKLLPILDAFHQAGKITQSGNSLPGDEVSAGLKMLWKQLMDVLQSEGLEEIPAVGEPLNPERHEVVSYTEEDDAPENTVLEEIRKGYLLHGKVIRPSLVVVSRRKISKDQKMEKAEKEGSP